MSYSLSQLFPNAETVRHKAKSDLCYYVPIDRGHWLAIPKEGLTAREEFLLSQVFDDQNDQHRDQTYQEDPWYQYLVEQSGNLPGHFTKLQFIHCQIQSRHNQDILPNWLEMMSSLFPNLISHFALDEQTIILIMDQNPSFAIKETLEQVLPNLEFDFEIKLHIFIGQIWTDKMTSPFPTLFQLEQSLFQGVLKNSGPALLTFAQALLQSPMVASTTSALLYQRVKQVVELEAMEAITKALWQEQAVLTKAAQALYLHRNSLQYRLDKFHEQTGLNLRQMDDLAICYLSLLS